MTCMTAPTDCTSYSVCDRDRGQRGELNTGTETQCHGNHRIGTPELQPADHRRSPWEKFVGEQSHMLKRPERTGNLSHRRAIAIQQLELNLEHGVVRICDSHAGPESA